LIAGRWSAGRWTWTASAGAGENFSGKGGNRQKSTGTQISIPLLLKHTSPQGAAGKKMKNNNQCMYVRTLFGLELA
jgi:hypothetical protein